MRSVTFGLVSLLLAVGCISSEGLKSINPGSADAGGTGATVTGGSTSKSTGAAGGGAKTGGAPSTVAGNTGGVASSTGGRAATGGFVATGGSAPACDPGTCTVGQPCTSATDCTSPLACVSNRCSTCGDGIQDGTEPQIDCGGGCATRCAQGATCNVNGDCETYNCSGGTCAASSNPLANLAAYPACNCVSNNLGVATKCKDLVVPCLLLNSCVPTDACAQNNDGVCGVNTLKTDAAPIALAITSYTCVLASVPDAG